MASQTLVLDRPKEARRVGYGWGLALGLSVTVVAYLPLLIAHALSLWRRSHYQFFPFVVLGAAVLVWARHKDLTLLPASSALASWLVASCAWLLLLLAEIVYSPWLAAVSFLTLLMSAMLAVGGRALVRQMLPAWLLLWLLVPPPFALDMRLVTAMQRWASSWSSAILDLLGVFHVLAGNVVETGGRRFLVEEACSGVNSLFSVLACTVFFVFYTQRPPIRAALLVLAAVAWVMVANVARIVGVAYLGTVWDINIADGWRHDAFGFLLFGLALLLIWSTDRLLCFLAPLRAGEPVRPPSAEDADLAQATVGRPAWQRSWLCSRSAAAAFLLLMILHVGLHTVEGAELPSGPAVMTAALDRLEDDTLPAKWRNWVKKDFRLDSRNPGSAYGEFSKQWTYQAGRMSGVLSLDYPFWGWHELTDCYLNQGWTVVTRSVHPLASRAGEPAGVYVEAQLSKPGFRHAHLLFSEIDDSGSVLGFQTADSPFAERARGALGRLSDRLRGTVTPVKAPPRTPIYQGQLFVESALPLTADDRQEAEALFRESLRILITK